METTETRVAVLSILVKNRDSVHKLNTLLHDYADVIIGRMGLPYKPRDINIICIALDAPQTMISALSGKIGALENVTVKATYADA